MHLMKAILYVFLFCYFGYSLHLSAQERHLSNIRQLTFGGDNAEGYFSPDGTKITFQSNNKNWDLECDQIFSLDIEKASGDSTYVPKSISTGDGRTTCSYFMPNGKDILYASTHQGGHSCPAELPRKRGQYFWSLFSDYDIYVANRRGKIIDQLTDTEGYDAEATVSPLGDKIVFTSTRSGDIELWTMDIDGSNQKQVTNILGYDGGAFFSPDGQRLVFRASRPKTEAEKTEYLENLKKGIVAPSNMEIYTCNVDGSDLKQVTNLGGANWAPFYHPSGNKIIFCSNHSSKEKMNFQLYMINTDGTNLEQITTESRFNSFPMFSPDGKQLIFASNRNNGGGYDTNLFMADWIE